MTKSSNGARNKTPNEVYGEAIDQINFAIKNRSKSIRLGRGRRGLQHLPSLSRLKELEALDLSGTGVRDIGAVADLTSLRELRLGFTEVVDLGPISKLKSLQKIFLTGSPVSDLEPLRNLKNLRELALGGRMVRNLEPLRELPNLESFYFPNGAPESWLPLTQIESLRNLSLFSASANNWDWLGDLPNASELFLPNANLSEIRFLNRLSELSSLDITSTAVSDLSPLGNLPKLRRLRIASTKVLDLKPLSRLSRLEALDIDDTLINDLRPLSELIHLQQLSFSDTPIADLTPLAELQSLALGAKRNSSLGLSFINCPLRDQKLRRLAKAKNPRRTVETINYLRRELELPLLEEIEKAPANSDKAIPSIDQLPSPDALAFRFDGREDGPIDLAPLTLDGERLLGSPDRREDYEELRSKALTLKELGTNRLGNLENPLQRLLSLPNDLSKVRAKLFWSRMNTLRVRKNAHAIAVTQELHEPDDRILEASVAVLLSDLVDTLNVFVVGDPTLMQLDAIRPGPQDTAEANQELELIEDVLDQALESPEIVTEAARESLNNSKGGLPLESFATSLSARQSTEFHKRSVRNFIGELLRRAYKPVRAVLTTAKSETGNAFKGVREGVYRAAGASLLTGAVTELSGITNFSELFVQFVSRHAVALKAYVTNAFQNPAISKIIDLISQISP